MCMKISKEDLLRINQGFGGNLIRDASIDFAFEKINDRKLGIHKKLAYIFRAILVDHPFTDGNKRTAAFVAFDFADKYGKYVDKDLLLHHILSIAKQNITNIKNIEWRLKNAIY